MLLNGAAGPDDGLWGLNAPFGFGAPERRTTVAWRGLVWMEGPSRMALR